MYWDWRQRWPTKKFSRMYITVDMIVTQWSTAYYYLVPVGKYFFCAVNFPGSWMDGSLTNHFFFHIKKTFGDYKICVDQGFPWSGDATGILVGLIPERSACRLHPLVRDNLICLSNFYTSLRQASEWGIRRLQGGMVQAWVGHFVTPLKCT